MTEAQWGKLRVEVQSTKDMLDQTLHWFDDSKAGGSFAQQLSGMALECQYILNRIDSIEEHSKNG